MRLPTPPKSAPEINMLSMIDVLFAILTFFIISSLSLTKLNGMSVNLPAAGNGKSQEQTKIVVTINEQGQLSVNRRNTSIDQLSEQLRQVISQEVQGKPAPSATNPITIIINADERVGHGQVVQLMDQVRKVPNIKIAIATKGR